MSDPSKTYFNIFCIDKRFDYLSAEYLKAIGFRNNYYSGTTAGASLCLGYTQYCSEICNCNCNHDNIIQEKNNDCNPLNKDMLLFKESLLKNIEISMILDEISEIYFLNHQDCGAIKAYLRCSGYPQNPGENNPLEISINRDLLLFASDLIKSKYPNIVCRLGLIDLNGTVCDYDIKYNTWNLIYRGPGNDSNGLWFGL